MAIKKKSKKTGSKKSSAKRSVGKKRKAKKSESNYIVQQVGKTGLSFQFVDKSVGLGKIMTRLTFSEKGPLINGTLVDTRELMMSIRRLGKKHE